MPNNVDYVSCVLKKEFNPGSLDATFKPLNTPGFDDSVKIWKLYNPSSTISVELSLDGVNPHDFLPPGATVIVDFQTNHDNNSSSSSGTKLMRKGQIIWGRVAPNPTFIQIIGFN